MRSPRRFLWTALATVAVALCVGVGAAWATEYFSGPIQAGQTIPGPVDDQCNLPYTWITYNQFDKGTSDYGRVFFSNDAGSWLDEVNGYGNISTSTGSNYKYQKRADVRNPTSIGYIGEAYFGTVGQGFVCT